MGKEGGRQGRKGEKRKRSGGGREGQCCLRWP